MKECLFFSPHPHRGFSGASPQCFFHRLLSTRIRISQPPWAALRDQWAEKQPLAVYWHIFARFLAAAMVLIFFFVRYNRFPFSGVFLLSLPARRQQKQWGRPARNRKQQKKKVRIGWTWVDLDTLLLFWMKSKPFGEGGRNDGGCKRFGSKMRLLSTRFRAVWDMRI